MSDDKSMLSGRVPDELVELVRADSRPNQEVLETALWREFGGVKKGAIDRRIEEKKRRISTIESEKNERERELEEEEQALAALKERRDSMESAQQQSLRKDIEKIQTTTTPLGGKVKIKTPDEHLEQIAEEHDITVAELKERVKDNA